MGSVTKTKTTDKLVRAKLIENLKLIRKDQCLTEEFSIARGKARADIVAVAEKRIDAYEIKSDVDNLLRLPRQAKYYSLVFSTVTLVVGVEHAVKALYLIPDWWGVTVAQVTSNGVVLNSIRTAKENTNVDYAAVSDVLSKEELVAMLGKYAPGRSYWNMSKSKLIDEARTTLTEDLLISDFPEVILGRNAQALAKA